MRSELEDTIRAMAIIEGILGKKLPENPKLDFGYELNFPPKSAKPMRIMLVKPIESKAISFQIATQIGKPHLEALNSTKRYGFYFNLFKKYMLTQNLLYNLDIKKGRYVILDNLYPDGLTENSFYLTVRRVFNAAVFMNITLMEIIGSKIQGGKDAKTDGDDLDFSQGSSMFA